MKRSFFSLFSLLLTAFFYLIWWKSPALQQLDYKFYDRLSRTFPSHQSPDSTVIVEIDDKSLKALGQWPWPRMITSELVNTIADAKPSAVVFDIVFSEKDRSSPDTLILFYRNLFDLNVTINGLPAPLQSNDALLSEAIGRVPSVLPIFSDAYQQNRECKFPDGIVISPRIDSGDILPIDSLVCSQPILQERAKNVGHIHAIADEDGVLRRLSLFIRHNETLIPTLGLSSVASAYNETIHLYPDSMFRGSIKFDAANHRFNTNSSGEILLRFYPKERYRTVSAYDLLNKSVDPKIMEGKIVLIGSNALGLDTWHTISDGTMRAGVFAHATLVENLINGDTVVQPEAYKIINFIGSFLIALVILYLMKRKYYLGVLSLFVAVSAGTFLITYLLWNMHIYISIGYFVVPLFSLLFILGLLMYIIDYRNTKRFIRDMQRAAEQKRRLSNALEKSETEIEYQKAMLFQQSKLAAMGEMIDNIAHQWRQPLNMLGVIVQDVEYAYRSGKVDAQYLDAMVKDSMEQIVFMSQTIEDFRNFVKPNQKNHTFDLNRALMESVQLLSGMFEAHNIAIEIDYAQIELPVFGSDSEFKQVIINLLNNAKDALLQHNPSSPKIIIKTSCDNTYVAITLQDNGGGITPNIIDRIFEPYFTTKEEGKGSGIGLYMSYSIVRTKMGGNIAVENVDDGTLFVLTFPLSLINEEVRE